MREGAVFISFENWLWIAQTESREHVGFEGFSMSDG